MSSKRLPGKSLFPVAGKPLLQYVVERVERAGGLSHVIVATSTEQDDDAIARFCEGKKILCHRGPLDNVAARFKEVVEKLSLDAFVRISGDSPLIDSRLIDQAVGLYRSGKHDLVSNVVVRTFPKGQSVEALASPAFLKGYAQMTDPSDKEHVTPFFYRHGDIFRIGEFKCEQDFSEVRLSVDSQEDLDRFQGIIRQMSKPHWSYGWKETVGLEARA